MLVGILQHSDMVGKFSHLRCFWKVYAMRTLYFKPCKIFSDLRYHSVYTVHQPQPSLLSPSRRNRYIVMLANVILPNVGGIVYLLLANSLTPVTCLEFPHLHCGWWRRYINKIKKPLHPQKFLSQMRETGESQKCCLFPWISGPKKGLWHGDPPNRNLEGSLLVCHADLHLKPLDF